MLLSRSDLHGYQLRAIDHIKSKPGSGLFLGMGLGKTISTITAIQDILDDFEVSKILIVAPLRVAQTVWHTEAICWEHTKDINFSIVTGNLKERISALNKDAEVYVINRENIPWLVDHYKSKWPFEMLVIDESSSFKNPTSKRFRALKKVLKYIKKSVILTGTPSPNGYMDLFSQIFILDGGERLGKNITRFRNTYFDKDFMGYNYTLKNGADKKIYDKIQELIISMKADDYLDLPGTISTVIHDPMPKNLLKQYKTFEEDMIMQMEGESITAMSAATLSNKLLQFSSGSIYDEKGVVHHIHNIKIEMLNEIVEMNPNENLLIAYNYKHEKEKLLKHFPDAVVMDKKGEMVDEWNAGKIKKLLIHPASAGHGVNLQKSHGKFFIWYGFNWSLELYEQANARLARQGNKNLVNIIHLAVGDIEYRLMRTLAKKGVVQADLLRALE